MPRRVDIDALCAALLSYVSRQVRDLDGTLGLQYLKNLQYCKNLSASQTSRYGELTLIYPSVTQ